MKIYSISWQELLAGALPFIIFGPVTILLAFPYPYPEYRFSAAWRILIICLYVIPILLGLVAGATKRFPSWAYPYVGMLLSILTLAIAEIVIPFIFQKHQELIYSLWFQIPVGAAIVWLTAAVILGLARLSHFLAPLYENVRRDWTRLSLALCMIPTIFSGMIDHDEEPVLTLAMFLSTACLVLGALAYLLSRTQRLRFLSLLGGLGLAIIFRTLDGVLVVALYMLWGAFVALIPCALDLLQHPVNQIAEST
jgi:hypothetical protein